MNNAILTGDVGFGYFVCALALVKKGGNY